MYKPFAAENWFSYHHSPRPALVPTSKLHILNPTLCVCLFSHAIMCFLIPVSAHTGYTSEPQQAKCLVRLSRDRLCAQHPGNHPVGLHPWDPKLGSVVLWLPEIGRTLLCSLSTSDTREAYSQAACVFAVHPPADFQDPDRYLGMQDPMPAAVALVPGVELQHATPPAWSWIYATPPSAD